VRLKARLARSLLASIHEPPQVTTTRLEQWCSTLPAVLRSKVGTEDLWNGKIVAKIAPALRVQVVMDRSRAREDPVGRLSRHQP
jgi:hypothetical protein